MRRREFMAGVGALGAVWPHHAFAQNRRIPTVGVLWHAGSAEEEAIYLSALREGFVSLGYKERQSIILEHRFPNEIPERFVSQAAELASLKVDVLVTVTQLAALAAKRATSTTPIVAVLLTDPVGSGLVDSLSRPGGNVTGLTNLSVDLSSKRLALFKEFIPTARRVAILLNATPSQISKKTFEEYQAAAASLGVEVIAVEVRTTEDLETAFNRMHREADGIIQGPSSLFYQARALMAKLAAERRIPLMATTREAVDAGALMSYATDLRALFRRSAYYVDKILKGEKPADLPVEQPTKFELLINLKTSRAIGLAIPETFLVRADGIVE